MSVDIGIIGLAKSGKTTIFNALTRGKAATEKSSPHIGVARVPEPRLEMLASVLNPRRVVPAEARFVDIGASVKGLVQDKEIGDQFLNQLGNVDALISVVRAFADESVPHVEGSVDVERDIAAMDLELIFHDLVIIEKRLKRLEVSLKGAKQAERQGLLHEQTMLLEIKAELERDKPIWQLSLADEEARTIAGYQFLTAKPLLIVVNIGEEQLPQAAFLEAGLKTRYTRPESRLITLCGKLEMELGQLDNSAAEGFRNEFGIKEAGLALTIKLCYELLGLITFFTIASAEVKAWPIPNGSGALKAAGKIHSDMERGFIRAEVINCDELVKCGGLVEARKRGLLRLEGKNYTVRDGDVITFLFNI